MPTVDPQSVTQILAYLISLFSPVIVEAWKRDTWKPAQAVLAGLMVSTFIYVGLHLLLGTLTYPVTVDFLAGLVAAFGTQQAGYGLLFKSRNQVIEVPVNTTTVVTPSAVVVGNNDMKVSGQ